jgi:hypothetical protein
MSAQPKDDDIMDARVERQILAEHADRLNAGLRGSASHPPMTSDQQTALVPLLKLAELLAETLIVVEPSPEFVQRLGQELAMAAVRSQLSLLERYRKTILVGVATIGSALSVVGLVLFYFFRQRDAARGTPTS